MPENLPGAGFPGADTDCDEPHDGRALRDSRRPESAERDEPHGDPLLSDRANAQRGAVSTADMRDAGLGRGAVGHRVARRRVHRVHRGVYLLGHAVEPAGAREAAALLAVGAGATLSHRSAAALWEMIPAWGGAVDVLVAGRRPRSRPGVRVRSTAALDPRDAAMRGGLPVTAPARTLLDLATVLPVPALERAGEQAHLRGLYRRADVLSLLERHPGARGARRQFHSSRAAFERDRRRDAELVARGFRVLRVTWRRLVRDRDAVLAELVRALDAG